MAIKILLGGSPCTHWSIAQNKNNRETKAEGIGWELFRNYLIAKEKFQPDIFLYENNKSASQAIKDQIATELGVGTDPNARFTYINSALVSAQNRQRFYVTNFGDIEQPEDRGILLKDILETNEPINITEDGKAQCVRATCYKDGIRNLVANDYDRRTCVAKPVGATRDGKSCCIKAQYQSSAVSNFITNGKFNASGVAEPVGDTNNKAYCLTANYAGAISCADGKTYTVYEVKDGQIVIKGKQYPIKLPDGYYIIRKLTVTECARLQTMPDDYCKSVSNSQAYKGLGNGWTAEVIIHILNHALKDVPRDEEIIVLSMYDGIGTGRYVLDKMGFTNVKYHAYEIDKYAMTISMDNYPDIIQHGDAFAVRNEDWRIEYGETLKD